MKAHVDTEATPGQIHVRSHVRRFICFPILPQELRLPAPLRLGYSFIYV
jgi:hypothetical protein